jgi:signal transduction histidine kinase
MAEQILSNLVNNAIKYGGGEVLLSASVAADMACFEVSDQGAGIDEEQRARIFQKFERLIETARHRSGYGLGLWIVGSMVKAHAGRIEVESQPGQGTRFRVWLPLRAAAAADQEETR